MDLLRVSGVELFERTGIHPTTVSRYRSADYASGPPAPRRRRLIEHSLGLPEGYLDGRVSMSDQDIEACAARTGGRPVADPDVLRVAPGEEGVGSEIAYTVLDMRLRVLEEMGVDVDPAKVRGWLKWLYDEAVEELSGRNPGVRLHRRAQGD